MVPLRSGNRVRKQDMHKPPHTGHRIMDGDTDAGAQERLEDQGLLVRSNKKLP
jgi:hypothetical protein